MKKIKQTIVFFSLLVIVLFASSCSNDVYENTIANSSELKIKKVTFGDFKNNAKAYGRYAELEEKKEQAYASRLIEDTINNFVINTEEASYIEKGVYNSYAFEIYRSDSHDGKVENILFSLNEEGSYDTYIVKYDFTEEELKTMSEQEIYSRPTKYTLLDDSSAERVHMEIFCIEVWQEVCDIPIDHGDNTGGPIEYDCRWVLHSVDCETSGGSAGGGGGGGISIDPGTSPGNNSPATGSDSGGTPLIITTPTTCGRCPDFNEELFDTVTHLTTALNLTAEERQWLYDHPRIAEKLEDFLNSGGDLVFADEAFEALIGGGEVDFTYRIIKDPSFVENPCLHNVYIQLGEAPTSQNYLNNFDGDFSVANLKLTTSTTLPNSENAETSAPENYLITITFNENNLDRPSLSIARTFIHELIHAEIFRKLLSVAGAPSIQFTQAQLIQLKESYPGLYDYYMRWKWNIPVGQSPSSAQHEAMAQHYRSIIEQALREYDNNSQTDEVYEALAWEGLKETVAWNNLSPSQKGNINQIISNFENNNPDCN